MLLGGRDITVKVMPEPSIMPPPTSFDITVSHATTVADVLNQMIPLTKVSENNGDQFGMSTQENPQVFLDPTTHIFSLMPASFIFRKMVFRIVVYIVEQKREEYYGLCPLMTIRDVVTLVESSNFKGKNYNPKTFKPSQITPSYEIKLVSGPVDFSQKLPSTALGLEYDRTLASYRVGSKDTLLFFPVMSRAQRWKSEGEQIPVIISAPDFQMQKAFKFPPTITFRQILEQFISKCNTPVVVRLFAIFLDIAGADELMDDNIQLGNLPLPTPVRLKCKARPRPVQQYFGVDPANLPMTTDMGIEVPEILPLLRDVLMLLDPFQQEGIFRKSGNETEMKQIIKSLNSGGAFISDNPHSVATLIKRWYKDLPKRIFAGLHKSILDDKTRCLNLYPELSPLESNLAKWLFELLVDTTEHAEVNKMSPNNLGIVFGPGVYGSASNIDVTSRMGALAALTGMDESKFGLDIIEINIQNLLDHPEQRPLKPGKPKVSTIVQSSYGKIENKTSGGPMAPPRLVMDFSGDSKAAALLAKRRQLAEAAESGTTTFVDPLISKPRILQTAASVDFVSRDRKIQEPAKSEGFQGGIPGKPRIQSVVLSGTPANSGGRINPGGVVLRKVPDRPQTNQPAENPQGISFLANLKPVSARPIPPVPNNKPTPPPNVILKSSNSTLSNPNLPVTPPSSNPPPNRPLRHTAGASTVQRISTHPAVVRRKSTAPNPESENSNSPPTKPAQENPNSTNLTNSTNSTNIPPCRPVPPPRRSVIVRSENILHASSEIQLENEPEPIAIIVEPKIILSKPSIPSETSKPPSCEPKSFLEDDYNPEADLNDLLVDSDPEPEIDDQPKFLDPEPEIHDEPEEIQIDHSFESPSKIELIKPEVEPFEDYDAANELDYLVSEYQQILQPESDLQRESDDPEPEQQTWNRPIPPPKPVAPPKPKPEDLNILEDNTSLDELLASDDSDSEEIYQVQNQNSEEENLEDLLQELANSRVNSSPQIPESKHEDSFDEPEHPFDDDEREKSPHEYLLDSQTGPYFDHSQQDDHPQDSYHDFYPESPEHSLEDSPEESFDDQQSPEDDSEEYFEPGENFQEPDEFQPQDYEAEDLDESGFSDLPTPKEPVPTRQRTFTLDDESDPLLELMEFVEDEMDPLDRHLGISISPPPLPAKTRGQSEPPKVISKPLPPKPLISQSIPAPEPVNVPSTNSVPAPSVPGDSKRKNLKPGDDKKKSKASKLRKSLFKSKDASRLGPTSVSSALSDPNLKWGRSSDAEAIIEKLKSSGYM